MLLSNSKSFFPSVPYVGSVLLVTWLVTGNDFFAYLSAVPAVFLFLSTAIYLVMLAWRFGFIVEVEGEINFITCLTYIIYTLSILLSFIFMLNFRGAV